MDRGRALHAMAFGALVAAATVGVILGALLVRPGEVLSVARNRAPTATVSPTAISTETPRPAQTATGTATPDAAATTRAMATATSTKAPPTATPAPTETPRPTSTPRPSPTNTPRPAPTNTPTSVPTTSPSPEPPRSPTASPAGPRPGQPADLTPEQTVGRYYELLDRRRFAANYAMLSASGQREAGSPSDWERAISPIVGARIRDITTRSQSAEEAMVTGNVELTRNVDGQITRSRYQANVFLVAEDGVWKIDRILRSNETTVP